MAILIAFSPAASARLLVHTACSSISVAVEHPGRLTLSVEPQCLGLLSSIW